MKRLLLPLAFFVSLSAQAQNTNKLPTKLPSKRPARSAEQETPQQTVTAPESESQSPNAESLGKRRVGLDAHNAIRLNYGYPLWNKSPKTVDSASILMREGSSGRTVQINLVETEPDSSIFSGIYSINWQNLERLQVEFYIPPQELLGSTEGMKKLAAQISSKQLKRKPFILRRSPTGAQSVEVFDTVEQARLAMKAYRAEQQIQAMQGQKPSKFPSDQEVDTARVAEDLKAREAMAKANAERIRLEQVEARRLQDLIAKANLLKEAEKAERRKQAEVLGNEGLQLFRAEKYQEAREKFDKAVELDPDNRLFYFQYGVTLYRVEDFNRSIAMLRLADGPAVNTAERDYFMALNHFRLKEFEPAIESFNKVIATKDQDMGPSAQFYVGVSRFEQKKWDDARKSFQVVLDTSKDPRLDERAETYIEQILRLQQFEAERARKWTISGTIGEMYDSNVLLTSDSQRDAGTASDAAGIRSLLTGSVRYRPVYEETREFAAQLDVLTMYTLDDSFKVDDSLRATDPTIATLILPWTFKGLMFGKGFKFDVTPGIESTLMSIENNENKEILQSYLLSFSGLFVMNNAWFSTYGLDLRYDNSKLDSAVGDNDASALKTRISNSNLIFLGDSKTKMMTAEGAYTLNQAAGRNAFFHRFDLGVGYIQPLPWELTGNLKFNYFNLAFTQNPNERKDNSFTFTGGLSRKINETWSTGFLGSYNINASNVEANDYSKFTALLTLSAQVGF